MVLVKMSWNLWYSLGSHVARACLSVSGIELGNAEAEGVLQTTVAACAWIGLASMHVKSMVLSSLISLIKSSAS
jgi:tellurite resistance protein